MKKKEASLSIAHEKDVLLEIRMNEFRTSLIPFEEEYGWETIEAFHNYWTEPNWSHTKLRFEMERTWDTSRRLATWRRNEKKYTNHHANTQTNPAYCYGVNSEQARQQRERDAADIIARLAAQNRLD